MSSRPREARRRYAIRFQSKREFMASAPDCLGSEIVPVIPLNLGGIGTEKTESYSVSLIEEGESICRHGLKQRARPVTLFPVELLKRAEPLDRLWKSHLVSP